MNFEAGALSLRFENSKVIRIAFNLKTNDILPPLSQFQASDFTEPEIWKLVLSINDSYVDNKTKLDVLEDTFDYFWIRLRDEVEQILAEGPVIAEQRDLKEKIDETLTYVKEIVRSLDILNNSIFNDDTSPHQPILKAHHTLLGSLTQFYNAVTRLDDTQLFYQATTIFKFKLQTMTNFRPIAQNSRKQDFPNGAGNSY